MSVYNIVKLGTREFQAKISKYKGRWLKSLFLVSRTEGGLEAEQSELKGDGNCEV